MRTVPLGLVAALVLAASCTDSNTHGPLTAPNGPNTASTFSLNTRPDEPASLSLVNQRGFSTRAKTVFDTAGSQGWATDERTYLGIVDDATAPMSPTKVGELTWRTGLKNGEPGQLWYDFKSSYRTVYTALWVKLSSNFQGNASNYNQMAVMWQAGVPRVMLQLQGKGSGTLTPTIVFNSTADSRQRLAATQPVAVTRGAWHLWELVARINTPGQSDGALIWYVDGVPAVQYTDLRVIGSGERDAWDSFYIWPGWNSVDVVQQTMTMRVDHAYISASPDRVDVAPSPPPPPLPAPVAAVAVSPNADTLTVGSTAQLTAVILDSTGTPLTNRVLTWTSADTNVARVSTTGLVTGRGAGRTKIMAASEGKMDSSVTVVMSTTTTSPPPTDAQLIFSDDFESGSFAKWTDGYNSSLHHIVTDATGAHTGTRYLDVTYPQGSNGGYLNTWFMPGYDSAYVSYWVRFPANWLGGGYLVGLYANRIDNMWSAFGKAGVCPNGTDYFTAFLFDEPNGNPGATHFYSYFPGMTSSGSQCWGNTSGPGSQYLDETSMSRGVWHHVEFFVKANTPGQADGAERFWIDGVMHGQWTGLAQRTTRDLMLNALQLTFNVANGAPQTQHVYVDDVEVRTGAVTSPLPAPVASVSVTLNSSTITVGQSTQANATTYDASGNVLTGRSITWTSSNPSVATVSSSGVVTSVAAGTAQITATSEGQAGGAALTVNAPPPSPVASVTVTLASPSLTTGQSTQATATLRDAQGNVLTGRTITWTSSASGVATVSSTGVVTAVAAGSAQIIATSEGQSGGATETVSNPAPAPVASVTVTLASAGLTTGQTTQATAVTRDASGNVLTGRSITWSTSDSTVARVSTSGLVTAVATGTAQIIATSEGQRGSATLTVSPPPVASVTVTLASSTLTTGQLTQATATLRDASGNVLTGRSVTWTSSNTSVATVSSSGLVTSIAAGTVQIIATSEGKTGSAGLTVNAPAPAPVASVTVMLASPGLTTGQTTQATATLRDAMGNVLTGRTITWTSSATSVATVSSSGVVTAVGAGSAQITATSEGQSGSAPLSVSSPTSGGASLLFASDFSTGLGNSAAAVSDASKTPHWNDIHPDADQLYVVNASGLGFPSGISNVLRVRYMGINSADVKSLNQWPQPTGGQSLFFRLYYRLDIPNSYGNLSSAGHHPIEPVPGSCPFQWEYRVSSNADGTMDWKVSLPNADYVMRLNKFQVYRFEWGFLNRSSTGAYKFAIRVYDASGAQIGSSATFIRMYSTASLATDNPDVALDASCIQALTVGSNGPTGWESVGTTAADAFSYVGGVAVSAANWIGPYVPGEHR